MRNMRDFSFMFAPFIQRFASHVCAICMQKHSLQSELHRIVQRSVQYFKNVRCAFIARHTTVDRKIAFC